jgi:hypothetical protein
MAQETIHWFEASSNKPFYLCGEKAQPDDKRYRDFCTIKPPPYPSGSCFVKRGYHKGLQWVRRTHLKHINKRFCRACNAVIRINLTISALERTQQ